jgi:hypothetical protein
MNYQRKYLKYKLKYLNIKKLFKRGGGEPGEDNFIINNELQKLKELESRADFEQDQKIVNIIQNEGLYTDVPQNTKLNPTLPDKPAGSGLSDVDVDLTILGNSIVRGPNMVREDLI